MFNVHRFLSSMYDGNIYRLLKFYAFHLCFTRYIGDHQNEQLGCIDLVIDLNAHCFSRFMPTHHYGVTA